jgi:L-amino acid N-acyltransferase YncA
MNSTISIRQAVAADIEMINEIFNYYVLNSTAMFQTEPTTLSERAVWFAEHNDRYPVIVAVSDFNVIGWGSLSQYYKRPAAWHTAEDSVYVRHGMHGKGIGSLLMIQLIESAKRTGFHSIVAEIHSQPTSLALHSKFGFQKAGHIREAGKKLDQWIDVVLMQKML